MKPSFKPTAKAIAGALRMSPDKQKKPTHKVRKPATTSENYLDKDLVAPGQDHSDDNIRVAKRILDENLQYLSKEAYLRLKMQVVQDRDPETIKVLLAYNVHRSVDVLVRNCMILFNEDTYNRMINKTNSPIKQTSPKKNETTPSRSANRRPSSSNGLSTQDRIKSAKVQPNPSIGLSNQNVSRRFQRRDSSKSPASQNRNVARNNFMTPIKKQSSKPQVQQKLSLDHIRQDIVQIREIMQIKKPGMVGFQSFQDVMRKLGDLIDDNQQITRSAFQTVFQTIFPEIKEVSRISEEGRLLIDDSINCLFNCFDVDRTERLTYRKLSAGLDVFCYN